MAKYEESDLDKYIRTVMADTIIDNYKDSWAYATTDQLIEELEIVYRLGVKGLENMYYEEIKRELEDKKHREKYPSLTWQIITNMYNWESEWD